MLFIIVGSLSNTNLPNHVVYGSWHSLTQPLKACETILFDKYDLTPIVLAYVSQDSQ